MGNVNDAAIMQRIPLDQATRRNVVIEQGESLMKRMHVGKVTVVAALIALTCWNGSAGAQTFSSGSNGSLGAFAPGANTTVTLPPDGILNYTTINIPNGVTVSFTPNAANTPVTMLATGDVTINGTITLNGANGTAGIPNNPNSQAGRSGGPGGFPGGAGGMGGATNTFGSAGMGPGGGTPTSTVGGSLPHATYGAPGTFGALLPLFGGSGGAGGVQISCAGGAAICNGESGAGGGGAIVMASTTKITVTSTGTITARGGDHWSFAVSASLGGTGGVGSGGAIRLVAPEITNQGTLNALGGRVLVQGFVVGGDGRIRAEALVFGPFAATTPAASIVGTLGPVTASSTPALINLPTLAFSSIGGIAPPASPTGSFTTADVTLPPTTTNPVSVTITATNTPPSITYTIKLLPQFAAPSSQTVNSTGTFAVSTANANVTFPNGRVSALQAFAGFTLTASVRPAFEGEEIERVMVAVGLGEPSSIMLVTTSGKEVTVEQLPVTEQWKLAVALDELRTGTQASTEAMR